MLLLLPLALAAGLGPAPIVGDTASRPAETRADRIVLDKRAHLLRLWHGGPSGTPVEIRP